MNVGWARVTNDTVQWWTLGLARPNLVMDLGYLFDPIEMGHGPLGQYQ